MPLLTPGQERKSGRRWVWVALAVVLGLLLPPVALLGCATVRPIVVFGDDHVITLYFVDDRRTPDAAPFGVSGGYLSPWASQWKLHLSHAVWTINYLQRP